MIPTTDPDYDKTIQRSSTAKNVLLGLFVVGFLGASAGLIAVIVLYKTTIFGACSKNPCATGEICMDTASSYECKTVGGGACDSSPCTNGEVCVDTTSGYECKTVGVAGMALAAEGSIYFSASYDRMSWDEASSHCATLHPKAHLMYPANQEKWWSYKKLLFPTGVENNGYAFWTTGKKVSGQDDGYFTWTNTGEVATVIPSQPNALPASLGSSWDFTGDCVTVTYNPGYGTDDILFYDTDCTAATGSKFTICELSNTDV